MVVRNTGDSALRIALAKGSDDRGWLQFGDGSTVRSRLREDSNGILVLDRQDSNAAPRLQVMGNDTGQTYALTFQRHTDVAPRVALGQGSGGTGAILFGPGSSAVQGNIAWSADGRLSTSLMMNAGNGFATRQVAGAISNATWQGGPGGADPIDGLLGVDSANNRLYIRINGAHRWIATNAGIVIPATQYGVADETVCPICSRKFVRGDRLVARFDRFLDSGDGHALLEHEDCAAPPVELRHGAWDPDAATYDVA